MGPKMERDCLMHRGGRPGDHRTEDQQEAAGPGSLGRYFAAGGDSETGKFRRIKKLP